MAFRDVGGAKEVTGTSKELISIISAGANADVTNGQARNWDGNETLTVDLQGNCGSSWNRLIEGNLDIESNVSASSNDKGERLNRDVVKREDILVSSIYDNT